jgi:hypothetical protein
MGHPFWRLVLLAAGLDAVLAGGWAVFRPDDLFAALNLAPTPDRLLTARALGGLVLTHAPFLGFAAARPERWGGLALVALAGRALTSGMWLWLLGARPGEAPAAPWLLAHDAAWLPLLAAFLAARRFTAKKDLKSTR